VTEASFVVRAPRAELRPFLSELCGVSYDEAGPPSRLLPDVQVAVVVQAASAGGVPRVSLRGPATQVGWFQRETGWALGVQLRPHAARALLGVPLDAFTDRQPSLAEVWPEATQLADRLAHAPDVAARFSLLEEALLLRARRIRARKQAPVVVTRAIAMLRAASTERIDTLATDLGVSARQLRRLFRESLGVSPKEYSAILRFQRASEALSAAQASLATVAHQVGYYDQAHMNLDFRQRAGVSPGVWASQS
jgi:AraC-like DNA-binding protein